MKLLKKDVDNITRIWVYVTIGAFVLVMYCLINQATRISGISKLQYKASTNSISSDLGFSDECNLEYIECEMHLFSNNNPISNVERVGVKSTYVEKTVEGTRMIYNLIDGRIILFSESDVSIWANSELEDGWLIGKYDYGYIEQLNK